MFNHKAAASQLEKILNRINADFSYSIAGTGTFYFSISSSDETHEDVKFRVADHGECYCSEDYSVDPDGITVEQAVKILGNRCGYDVSRSLAAFKASATRQRKAREVAEAKNAPAIAAANAEWEARLQFQKDWIAKNYPDYNSLPSKKQKRIRHRANKAFEASK